MLCVSDGYRHIYWCITWVGRIMRYMAEAEPQTIYAAPGITVWMEVHVTTMSILSYS